MSKRTKSRRKVKTIVDYSDDACPYAFANFFHCAKYKNYPVYCVKFYENTYVFAACIVNRVEIFDASEDVKLIQSYETPSWKEVLYTFDWTTNAENEPVLVAGGKGGLLYNVFKNSSFGSPNLKQKAVNDIKFSPTLVFLVAVACEDGYMYFFNLDYENCIAAFNPADFGDPPKQVLAIAFDPTGSYVACSRMHHDICVWDLKGNNIYQDWLAKSLETQNNKKFLTQLSSFGCIIKGDNFHQSFIDSLIWLGEFVLISKSCDGHIIAWRLDVDENAFPLFDSENVKIHIYRNLYVPACTFWFVRMAINSTADRLAIGTNVGQVHLWDLGSENIFSNQTTMSTSATNKTVRYISFSNDSNMIVYCTDNGIMCKHVLKDENGNVDVESEDFQEGGSSTSPEENNPPKRHKLKENLPQI